MSENDDQRYQQAADVGQPGTTAAEREEIRAYHRVAEAVRCAPLTEPPEDFACAVAARCSDYGEQAGPERWLMGLGIALAVVALLGALAMLAERVPTPALDALIDQAPWPMLFTAALVAVVIRAVEALPVRRVARPPG